MHWLVLSVERLWVLKSDVLSELMCLFYIPLIFLSFPSDSLSVYRPVSLCLRVLSVCLSPVFVALSVSLIFVRSDAAVVLFHYVYLFAWLRTLFALFCCVH